MEIEPGFPAYIKHYTNHTGKINSLTNTPKLLKDLIQQSILKNFLNKRRCQK